LGVHTHRSSPGMPGKLAKTSIVGYYNLPHSWDRFTFWNGCQHRVPKTKRQRIVGIWKELRYVPHVLHGLNMTNPPPVFDQLRPTVPCLRRGHSGWNEARFLARVVHLRFFLGKFHPIFCALLNMDVPGWDDFCMFKVWFGFIARENDSWRIMGGVTLFCWHWEGTWIFWWWFNISWSREFG